MNGVEWGRYNESWRGTVERKHQDKLMYAVWQDGKRVLADVDTVGGGWDNLDIEFPTIEEAKHWCEMHWVTVGVRR